MGQSCPLGIARIVPAEFFGVIFDHIIYPLLTKLVWSRWPDRTWPISSLTSRLVNNAYIISAKYVFNTFYNGDFREQQAAVSWYDD